MGYRSEVKSLVYGEPAAMAKFMADNAELVDAIREDFGSDLTHTNNDAFEIMFLDLPYGKWYKSYSEVTRWHNLLNLADEAGLITEFVRIGEDSTGDIEQDYSLTECKYYLSVNCSINANF